LPTIDELFGFGDFENPDLENSEIPSKNSTNIDFLKTTNQLVNNSHQKSPDQVALRSNLLIELALIKHNKNSVLCLSSDVFMKSPPINWTNNATFGGSFIDVKNRSALSNKPPGLATGSNSRYEFEKQESNIFPLACPSDKPVENNEKWLNWLNRYQNQLALRVNGNMFETACAVRNLALKDNSFENYKLQIQIPASTIDNVDPNWVLHRFDNRNMVNEIRGFIMKSKTQKSDLKEYLAYETELFDQNRVISGQFNRQRRINDCWWNYYRILLGAVKSSISFNKNNPIFKPCHFDATGRMHPFGIENSVAGNMLVRSMYEFYEGSELTESGKLKLWEYLRSVTGFENETNEELEKFVSAVSKDPLETVENWSKVKNPMLTLATVFELEKLLVHENMEKTFGDEQFLVWPPFVTHLPISIDGSCNGLQHFSAITKDEKIGKYVNLVDTEKHDLYTSFAKLISTDCRQKLKVLPADFELPRNTVKFSILAIPYGISESGLFDNFNEELKNQKFLASAFHGPKNLKKIKMLKSTDQITQIARFLSCSVRKHKHSLGKPVKLSAVLNEIMDLLSALDIQPKVSFLEPGDQGESKIHHLSSNKDFNSHLIQFNSHNKTLGYKQLEKYVGVNRTSIKRTRQKYCPHLIQYLDSYHLRSTIEKVMDLGVPVFGIHDSIWTTASNIDLVSEIVREQFHELYSTNDVIELMKMDFLKLCEDRRLDYHNDVEFWLKKGACTETAAEVYKNEMDRYASFVKTEICEKLDRFETGNLDVEEVKNSKHFFS